MEGLDEFARSFADELFAAVPRLRSLARVENGAFWISTDDGEVTVGFGICHMHFDWPARDASVVSDPISSIRSVMADETLVEDWTLDGRWAGSSILAAGEEPDLEGMKAGHVVCIRSWSGSRDRTIRGR